MHVVLAIVGAILGFSLDSGSRGMFAAVLGGFAGYALAELQLLRTRFTALKRELADLQASVARQRDEEQARQTAESLRASAAAPTSPIGGSVARESGVAPEMTSGMTPRVASGAASAKEPASGSPPGSNAAPASAWGAATAASAAAPSESPILRVIREYFTGGNTLVRVGVLILFFGVAFLLRYIAEHSHVPIQFRLAGVACGGIALLVLGWALRKRRSGYALALQGGGAGILYLTVFAALRFYSLLPPTTSFALLVLLAAFTAALAVLQNSQAFALLAVIGGFLAPILASTGDGSHVVLFSYYAVLNASILAIAWYKAWRPLNLAGFVFTFVVGAAWGALRYHQELFASTEPFLVLFFLFYLAIAILFSLRQPPELRGYVDGTLIFGTPIAAFGYQSEMLHDKPIGLAGSAVVVGVFYFALAWVLHRRQRTSQRLLVEAFMALGVMFLTVAVPLALDGRSSGATWALEGAALVWIGCRQDRVLSRVFGALLQIAGGIALWGGIDLPYGAVPVLNGFYLAGAMVGIASVFSAASLQKYAGQLQAFEAIFPPILFFLGLLWWLFSGFAEIHRHAPHLYETSVALVFVTATALACSELCRRTALHLARLPALWLLPALALFAMAAVVKGEPPFSEGGWLAWPIAFAGFYVICRRHEGPPRGWRANSLHIAAAWLLIALVTWEVAWAIDQSVRGSWPAIGWMLVPAIVLFALPRLAERIPWPVQAHREAYVVFAGSGFAAYLALWSLVTNVSLPGDPYPLPYAPLLNPLDLAELLVLLVLGRFWLHLKTARYPSSAEVKDAPVVAGLAALAFIWLNAALLRTLHHWAGVPFELEPLLSSTLVQTALTIFWTLLALATMLGATRRANRVVWLTGATLLAVAIVKLFVVDLSRVGTVERIVSFVGVGLLTLVIGYFSPLPPAATTHRTA
ncbi:MAG: hypothetical protein JWM63_5761 [Gammaproteobacteria bacterium]|nr:hypothetical protein [Gammaproteobacteria bacterium]